jgi:4-amino-4-deoxy-L-arabinose transferase-like glycosyltransferase
MTPSEKATVIESNSRRVATVLVLLMLLAAGLRLGVGLARQDQVYWLGDSQVYRELGHNLAAGRGLTMTDFAGRQRRADRMPGYPAILAALDRVAGDGAWSLLAAQAVVGALAVLLVYLLGRELSGPLAGLAAAALMAVMPWQVYFSTVALTECWSAALLAATIFCAVRAARCSVSGFTPLPLGEGGPSGPGEGRVRGWCGPAKETAPSPPPEGGTSLLRHCSGQAEGGGVKATGILSGIPGRTKSFAWAAAAGLACATLMYMHPEFLGLPLAFGLVASLAKDHRKWLAQWFVAAVVIVAALLPWWVRNHEVLGRTVIATTRLGPTLYDGVRPEATGESDMRFEQELAPGTNGMSEVEYDAYYKSKAWAAIWADPGRIARLAAGKAARLWSPTPHAAMAQGRLYYWTSLAAFVVMVAGALVGLAVLARGRGWAIALLLVPVVWVTLVHLVLPGSIRYRAPVEPLLFVLAGAAVAWLARREGRMGKTGR